MKQVTWYAERGERENLNFNSHEWDTKHHLILNAIEKQTAQYLGARDKKEESERERDKQKKESKKNEEKKKKREKKTGISLDDNQKSLICS